MQSGTESCKLQHYCVQDALRQQEKTADAEEPADPALNKAEAELKEEEVKPGSKLQTRRQKASKQVFMHADNPLTCLNICLSCPRLAMPHQARHRIEMATHASARCFMPSCVLQQTSSCNGSCAVGHVLWLQVSMPCRFLQKSMRNKLQMQHRRRAKQVC